jgi:hypothetical protein
MIAAPILACLLCGCSIFDLKNPEAPEPGTVTEDPLNIGDVLSIVRESAASMDYRDYFTPDARFETPSLLRPVEGRDGIVQMLNRLRPRASLVEWHLERGEKSREGNLMIIRNLPYTVYPRTSGEQTAGLADFHIVRETGELDWMINYWKDMPGASSEPFFEP